VTTAATLAARVGRPTAKALVTCVADYEIRWRRYER
jgi:hypothetical protein